MLKKCLYICNHPPLLYAYYIQQILSGSASDRLAASLPKQPAAWKTRGGLQSDAARAGSCLPDRHCRGTSPLLIKPAGYWSCPKDWEPFTSSQEMGCHYPCSSVMNLTCGDQMKSRAAWHLLSCLMHSEDGLEDQHGWYSGCVMRPLARDRSGVPSFAALLTFGIRLHPLNCAHVHWKQPK